MGTPLDDRDLAADIALLGEVIAAVAGEDHELSDSEVDEVLGVAHTLGPTPGTPGTPGTTPVARHTAG